MDIAGSLKVIGAGAGWRLLGGRRSGRALLDAFSADDEQERMLAGIALVKAGDRSVDLIAEAVAAGKASADVVRLLADIGTPQARAALTRLAAGEGPPAAAAREALDLLARIDELEDEG